MSNYQQQPCMRCEREGLVCEYVATEKQRARGTGSKSGGHKSAGYPPSTAPPPGPSTQQNRNFGAAEPPPLYGGHDYYNSPFVPHAEYAPSVPNPPPFGGNAYTNNPYGGPSYSPSSQQHSPCPSVPNYGTPQYAAGTPYSGTNSSSVPPANSGYSMNYGTSSYGSSWTANQSRQAYSHR
ncbi:hypothetical protein C8R45DRAFT_945682 [Mycena sanguinolenta]|nr:hypothetical protein C8R45DRAFT_945682 [Mycena sanguinolenta]